MEQIAEEELTGGGKGSSWREGGGDRTASGTNKKAKCDKYTYRCHSATHYFVY